MNPSTLARLQHDLVDPERCHPELPSQGEEAIPDIGIKTRTCSALMHR